MKTEEVISRLNEKLSQTMKCPMCGNNHFSLVDGFFINSIQKKPGEFQFGGQSIPTVSIICNRCGFVSQHAIGVLDPDIMQRIADDK